MSAQLTKASFRQRFRADARVILRLAGPLMANNIAVAGMSFTDTVMAGQLSAGDLEEIRRRIEEATKLGR